MATFSYKWQQLNTYMRGQQLLSCGVQMATFADKLSLKDGIEVS
jgi:hypothetical protein